MKMMLAATAITLGLTGITGQAEAQSFPTTATSAVNNCQGALPSFEGAFRKRPLGVANEGTSLAFLSCAALSPSTGDSEIYQVAALFINRGGASATVDCTLVDGIALPFPSFPPIYLPKSVAIPAGAFSILVWNDVDDNGGDPFEIPNISCALPPGVEINLTEVYTQPTAP